MEMRAFEVFIYPSFAKYLDVFVECSNLGTLE